MVPVYDNTVLYPFKYRMYRKILDNKNIATVRV